MQIMTQVKKHYINVFNYLDLSIENSNFNYGFQF